MPRKRPIQSSPNSPNSISPPRRNKEHTLGYKKSPYESPVTEPISPDNLIKMIALLKTEIKHPDLLELIIDSLQKKVEKQRIRWQEERDERLFASSILSKINKN